jgi:hypothetical protein
LLEVERRGFGGLFDGQAFTVHVIGRHRVVEIDGEYCLPD